MTDEPVISINSNKVKYITMPCCKIKVWSGTNAEGNVVESFGYSLYQLSGICVSCGRVVRKVNYEKEKEREIA